jgi:hypothetical protein
MEPKRLWSTSWVQPYATTNLRPYLRAMQEQLEASIEQQLEEMEYTEANELINRIKAM